MPRNSDANRLRAIVDLDIAVVLASVVSDVRQQLELEEGDLGDVMLDGWETALGEGVSAVVDAVREIRGHKGYQAAAARFSLKQKWRKAGMDQFHYALRTRSRRGIDRWAWIARAYRNDLEEFVVRQQRILRNREILALTQENLSEHPPKRFRVLDAIVLARYAALRPPENLRPALRLHALARIAKVIEVVVTLEERQHTELADRELWKERAEAALGDRLPRESIARLPSVAFQSCAYQQLLHEEEQRRTVTRALSQIERMEQELATLGRLLDHAP